MESMNVFVQEVIKVGRMITDEDKLIAALLPLMMFIKLLRASDLSFNLSWIEYFNSKVLCKRISSQLLQLNSQLIFCSEMAAVYPSSFCD
jgi:hypothetical protein